MKHKITTIEIETPEEVIRLSSNEFKFKTDFYKSGTALLSETFLVFTRDNKTHEILVSEERL